MYTIDFSPICQITEEQFYQLCQKNSQLKLERSPQGQIIIIPPTGGETGKINAKLISRFVIWNEANNLGEVFDSSTCFKLPNGANRSPDISFIIASRWNSLTSEEKEKFPPLAPDFVLELLSPSDILLETKIKMLEYIDNGVRLGWLINRKQRQVEIYRANGDLEILNSPNTLSGEDVLLNFSLYLRFIWN
jgi:Uma2 family endonuclease